MADPEGVPLRRRAAAAGIAACVSAVVVNPLDVVKTRLQAQGFRHAAATTSNSSGAGFSGRVGAPPRGSYKTWSLATAGCPPVCPTTGNPAFPKRLCAPECQVYSGSLDVFRKVVRQEGVRALFRGTDAALLIAVPTVGIYLPLYDTCNEWLTELCKKPQNPHLAGFEPVTPALAGAASRTVAVLCVAPLDLVRTRALAVGRHNSPTKHKPPASGVWHSLSYAARGDTQGGKSLNTGNSGAGFDPRVRSVFANGGAIRRLWTGTGPTLARDVPYSALYWFTVERLRLCVTETVVEMKRDRGELRSFTNNTSTTSAGSNTEDHQPSYKEKLAINFVSGVVAGGLVAGATTPLDVVKTRVQIRDVQSPIRGDFAGGLSRSAVLDGVGTEMSPEKTAQVTGPSPRRGLLAELRVVAREGGWRSLFAGWAPRAARAGPTCGIVLVAYEMAKNAPVDGF